MNKTEFIEEIAERADSSTCQAQRYVDAFEEVIAKALRGGEEVQITGFEKFYVREQKGREGINPQTKEKMRIPPSKVPSFNAGKGLKETV